MSMFIHSNRQLAPLGKFLFTLDVVNGEEEGQPSGYFSKISNSLDVLERLRTLEKLNRDFRYGLEDTAWKGSNYDGIADYVYKNWDTIEDILPCDAIRELDIIRIQCSDNFVENITPSLIQYTAHFYYPDDIKDLNVHNSDYYDRRHKVIYNLVEKCWDNYQHTASPDIPDVKPFIKPDFNSLIENTDPKMFKNNFTTLCEQLYYQKNPMSALKEIIHHTDDSKIISLKAFLKEYGLTDEQSTKNILSQWVRDASKNSLNKPEHNKYEDISQTM